MKTKASIENIVSAITVNRKIDLKDLVRRVKGLEYNPDRFPGVVYRIREPKVAMLIFSSGKIICTGAKSREAINEGIKKLLKKFEEGGIRIKEKPKVEIQNIVASAKINIRINLDLLAMECDNTEYEPEQFPGLVLRLDDPKTVMLVFRSGKIIITGARTPKDADIAVEKTRKIIEETGAVM